MIIFFKSFYSSENTDTRDKLPQSIPVPVSSSECDCPRTVGLGASARLKELIEGGERFGVLFGKLFL